MRNESLLPLVGSLAFWACAQGSPSSKDTGHGIDAARDAGTVEQSGDAGGARDTGDLGGDVGRLPDAGGLGGDVGASIDAGAAAGDAGAGDAGIVYLPDVQVTKLYQLILDRAPDPAGLQYWSGELAAHRKNIDDIIVAFLSSDEFHQIVLGFATTADFTAYTFGKLLGRAPTEYQQRVHGQLAGGTAIVDTMARAAFQMVLNSNQCRAANPEIFPTPQAFPALAAPDCTAEGFDNTIYLDIDPDIDIFQFAPTVDTIGNNGANNVEYWSPKRLDGQGIVVIKFTTDRDAPASFGQSYVLSHVSAVEYPATQTGRTPELVISDSPCDWSGAGNFSSSGNYYLGQSGDLGQTADNTLAAGRTYFLIVTHRSVASGDFLCSGDDTSCNLRIATPNFTRPRFAWVDHGAGVW